MGSWYQSSVLSMNVEEQPLCRHEQGVRAMKTTCKEQPAICLWHIGSGPNGCRCQPIPLFAEAEGKFIAETQQYMEEQFVALEDQLKTSPTQMSNMGS